MNNHFFNFFLEASKGLVPNHRVINLRGQNTDIDTSTVPETIGNLGSLYEFVTYDTGTAGNGSVALRVVSSSTADDVGSTGATSLFVEGLDKDWKVITEQIALDGTSTVLSANKYLRLNDAYVIDANQGEKNAGIIGITNNTDPSHDLGSIRVGEGKMFQAVYTVPADHTAYILEFEAGMSRSATSGSAVVELITREPTVRPDPGVAHTRLTHHALSLQADGSRTFNKFFTLPIKVPQKSDIFVECTYVSANNTAINSNVAIILVDDGE